MNAIKRRWFKHTKHGYMLRHRLDSKYDVVVTALCLDTAELEDNEADWEAHKSRLRVNGGCGSVAVDEMLRKDHNTEFKPTDYTNVPQWIKQEFEQYTE